MKSDREFIDGIYKKAAGCKESSLLEKDKKSQSNIRRIKWRTAVSFAAVLLTGILCIGLIIDSRKENNSSILEKNAFSIPDDDMKQDNVDASKSRNSNTTTIIEPFTFNMPDNVNEALNIIYTEAEKSDIVISGTIINTYNENDHIYNEVQINSCYKGSINEDCITIKNMSESLYNISGDINYQMLLFLCNVENDIYQLTDESEGVFILNQDLELGGIYERYDGTKIYENELFIGMFSE